MFQLRLKQLREQKKISQQQLANALSVSQSTVGMWESGKNKPEYTTLLKIAEYFGVSLDELAGEKESPILITQHGGDGPIIVRNGKKTEREKSLDALVLACQKLSPEQINALLATAQLMAPKDGKE